MIFFSKTFFFDDKKSKSKIDHRKNLKIPGKKVTFFFDHFFRKFSIFSISIFFENIFVIKKIFLKNFLFFIFFIISHAQYMQVASANAPCAARKRDKRIPQNPKNPEKSPKTLCNDILMYF